MQRIQARQSESRPFGPAAVGRISALMLLGETPIRFLYLEDLLKPDVTER